MKFEWDENQEYYYFIWYHGDGDKFGLAKIQPKNTSNRLFPLIKINKIYTPDVWLGGDPIKEGAKVSANQLQGVGGGGPEAYIFKNGREIIKRIFKKEITV